MQAGKLDKTNSDFWLQLQAPNSVNKVDRDQIKEDTSHQPLTSTHTIMPAHMCTHTHEHECVPYA